MRWPAESTPAHMEARQYELITTLDNHTKVNSSTMYRFQRRTLKSQRHLPFVELLVHTGGQQYTPPALRRAFDPDRLLERQTATPPAAMSSQRQHFIQDRVLKTERYSTP